MLAVGSRAVWPLTAHVQYAQLPAAVQSQMTLEEKVGMLLINTLNAGEKGKMTDAAVDLIEKQKMTRFVFRNTIKSNPVSTGTGNGFAGVQISPFEAAQFMNAVQELSERTRLGIPALFKSNSRNHIEFDPDRFRPGQKRVGWLQPETWRSLPIVLRSWRKSGEPLAYAECMVTWLIYPQNRGGTGCMKPLPKTVTWRLKLSKCS